MKIFLFAVLMFLLLPFTVTGEQIQIDAQTVLHFKIPAGWEWAKTAPQPLLEEFAEHIAHEAEEKGFSPTQTQLLAAAEKRLAANEVLLYNPETLSHITLDMSHLRQGEKPPSKKTIRLSAKYAGQSLENEEGVSGLKGKSSEASINGAWYAYRYDAQYLHHEEKMQFSGFIGFVSPHWFFFYFTDYLKDPADQAKGEQVFQSIRIEKLQQ